MMSQDAFYKKVIDFLLKLRCENTFDDHWYAEIYETLKTWVKDWKTQDNIPKLVFVACMYLAHDMAGGNRFLSEGDCIKVEDASIAIEELMADLDNFPYYEGYLNIQPQNEDF